MNPKIKKGKSSPSHCKFFCYLPSLKCKNVDDERFVPSGQDNKMKKKKKTFKKTQEEELQIQEFFLIILVGRQFPFFHPMG